MCLYVGSLSPWRCQTDPKEGKKKSQKKETEKERMSGPVVLCAFQNV